MITIQTATSEKSLRWKTCIQTSRPDKWQVRNKIHHTHRTYSSPIRMPLPGRRSTKVVVKLHAFDISVANTHQRWESLDKEPSRLKPRTLLHVGGHIEPPS